MGQRDLPYAPDTRSGFEMVLLRMLAFRPEGPGDREQRAVPAPDRRTASPRPATPPAEPAPTPRAEVAGGTDFGDWHGTVDRLGLGGMALQLARNCTVQAWDGEVLVLALEPAHAHLLGSLAEERLKDALGRLAGRPIRLRVAVGEVSGETPAQRADRASAERRAAAVEAMRSDGVVQALAEQFDARLVEESVAPVDDAPSSRTGRD